jgi:hypothetical protein
MHDARDGNLKIATNTWKSHFSTGAPYETIFPHDLDKVYATRTIQRFEPCGHCKENSATGALK